MPCNTPFLSPIKKAPLHALHEDAECQLNVQQGETFEEVQLTFKDSTSLMLNRD